MKFMTWRKKQVQAVKKEAGSGRKAPVAFLTMLMMLVLGALPVLAESGGSSGMSTVTSSLTSSFSEVASSATSMITSMLPVIVPVLGAMVLIRLGFKVFKRLTSGAA